ncbi:MAG: phosphatidylserine synthase [Lachnospiraceae bacterium]|nr:phosphatidylserine synthase [Lachnospiraceae bacterium]MCI9151662.1 phosphatidylserine synthase [Lachnospiraceae bacterium]
MLGYYDYTVILTYFSLISAGVGIFLCLSGNGHPYLGVFFLLFCGLCDAFDGKVARTKRDRTPEQRCFGIQIDSLSDLVAFGVLPACIGIAMLRISPMFRMIMHRYPHLWQKRLFMCALGAVLVLYMLATMIRLAYFNVAEQERQNAETGVRKYYTGLPVTSASLIFPLVLLMQYVIPADVTAMYFGTAIFTGFAFLSKIRVKKPGLRGILIMVAIGAVECALVILGEILK